MKGTQIQSGTPPLDRSAGRSEPMARTGSKLRVVMVATRVHPHVGGVETHVAEVAPRLLRAGIDITVLSTDDTGQRPAFEVVNGVPVRRVPAWPKGSDYAFAPGVYGEIARGSYDLVHCEGYHTLVPPLALP